jgi:hypothetical protein
MVAPGRKRRQRRFRLPRRDRHLVELLFQRLTAADLGLVQPGRAHRLQRDLQRLRLGAHLLRGAGGDGGDPDHHHRQHDAHHRHHQRGGIRPRRLARGQKQPNGADQRQPKHRQPARHPFGATRRHVRLRHGRPWHRTAFGGLALGLGLAHLVILGRGPAYRKRTDRIS